VPGYGQPVGYDPAQSYIVYQAAPTDGFSVPVLGQQTGYDPLISPDYGGWWRRGTTLLKAAWVQLAVLQAVGFVASMLVVVPEGLYAMQLTDDLQRSQSADPAAFDPSALLAMFGLIFLALFLVYLVKFAVTIASNHVGVAVAAGLRPQLGGALALGARRLFPLLGWQLLAGLIVLAGVCACFLPAIYLSAVFMLLPAVVTFERGGSAISRCFRLFHHDLGAAAGRIATIFGIAVGVAVLGSLIGEVLDLIIAGTNGSGVFGQPSDPGAGPVFTGALVAGLIASSVVSGLIDAAGAVLTSVLTLTAYADLRARIEPLSTATLAAEVGLTPATAADWTAA
jgi:hypothetical protein